jgi:peroxiredoxin
MRKYLLLVAISILPAFAAGELSGRRAPGFSLVDLNLNYHDLYDQRGKVVLVDIMRTDCPHCLAVSKNLERIKAKYGDKIAILSVVTPPDTQATVKDYLTKNRFTMPILFDCGQVAASYLKIDMRRPTISVPHVFVIDQQGMIRNDFPMNAQTEPIVTGDGLAAEIDKLLTRSAPQKKAAK